MRIFRPGVDVALGGTDGEAGDRHALDQAERVAFHQHPVGIGAGIALIGIADDVFARAVRLGDGLPLDAGREAGAAAAAQAGRQHGLDRRRRPDLARALQPCHAAMGAVVVQRQRIDDAAAGESQPGLAGQERDFLRNAQAQALRGACQQTVRQQAGNVVRRRPGRRRCGLPAFRPRSSVPARTGRVTRCAPRCRAPLRVGPTARPRPRPPPAPARRHHAGRRYGSTQGLQHLLHPCRIQPPHRFAVE